LVALVAAPVVPDSALALDAAPEFELLDAWPTLVEFPVFPLGAGLTVVVVDGGVWATAALAPRKTRRAAMRAPTRADTLEIIFFAVPGLPVFMLIPCRCWSSTTLSGMPTPAGRSRSVFLAA
jgi:hypothetical protein